MTSAPSLLSLALSYALVATSVSLTLMLGATPIRAADAAPPSLEVGEPFPSLELPRIRAADEFLSIENFLGHRTLVHVFASW